MAVLEGVVAFESLNKTDVFNGTDTGKYNITLKLSDDVADELKAAGVKLKEYEGVPQRKFATKFPPMVVDAEGNPFKGQVTFGSKVRIKYSLGKPHPMHGVSPQLAAVKVLELAEGGGSGGFDEEF